MRAYLIWALAALLLSGCKADCLPEEATVEVGYGWTHDLDSSLLAAYQAKGWSCSPAGHVRNAWGEAIAQRYTCKRCN